MPFDVKHVIWRCDDSNMYNLMFFLSQETQHLQENRLQAYLETRDFFSVDGRHINSRVSAQVLVHNIVSYFEVAFK